MQTFRPKKEKEREEESQITCHLSHLPISK